MIVRLLTEQTTKHLLIVLLMVSALLLMGSRWLYFDPDRIAPEDLVWKISIAAQIETEKNVTVVRAVRPKYRRSHKLISQRFYYPQFKLTEHKTEESQTSDFMARANGLHELVVEYYIQVTQAAKPPAAFELPVELRQKFLQSDATYDLSLRDLINLNVYLERQAQNKEQLLDKIFHYVQKLVPDKRHKYDDIKHLIKTNKATTLGRSRLMVALCRMNGIPARVVTGFILEENKISEPHHWVQVYSDDHVWQHYDAAEGYAGRVPNSYIIFNYDTPELFSVEKGKLLNTKYSIWEDLDILNVTRFNQDKAILDIFDLRQLDYDTRQTLIKLLILPFCVLLTVLFRHVMGLFPYGVFTAPLLALAMVYADIKVTLIMVVAVISLALIGRSILPKTLARSPRLSLIFTFVSLSMVLSISTLNYFSIDANGHVVLLPTIILASIVDRFYSYMDQSGAHAAILRMGVTILIALFCIPILKFEALGNFIVRFPEAHLITAAMVLALSSYRWKKITDSKYLSLLGENKIRKSSKGASAKPPKEEAED